jgi:RNA-binding protein YlmH
MAIIPQRKFFSWEEIQPLGDLERLQLVRDTIPDEPWMRL